jgi:hypothetical protein
LLVLGAARRPRAPVAPMVRLGALRSACRYATGLLFAHTYIGAPASQACLYRYGLRPPSASLAPRFARLYVVKVRLSVSGCRGVRAKRGRCKARLRADALKPRNTRPRAVGAGARPKARKVKAKKLNSAYFAYPSKFNYLLT